MKQYIGKNCVVEILNNEQSIGSIVEEKVALQNKEEREDAFFIGDLGNIVDKHSKWLEQLPRVKPFYAVKCNTDHAVLKLLADLGLSFDCASKAEIEKILELGVSPSRIIYANPCKQSSFIKYAARKQVSLMTFDNEDELHKVKEYFPGAKLVLRILPPSDFKVQCELGMKFGCLPKKAYHLLEAAKRLRLDVVGVSFHVGSGCEEAGAFAVAVEQAREVFDAGLELGFNMNLLDIGGGFPGQETSPITFEEIAKVLNASLDKHFPKDGGVEIIAEPGRYYVASAFSLTVNIIAKRVVNRDQQNKQGPIEHHSANEEPSIMYYVNDGVYGSFNCLLYDHAKVTASLVSEPDSDVTYGSSIWGPTCDGLDCILEETLLPELSVGDWIFFADMGAYTLAAASGFNGMPQPRRFYICAEEKWTKVYPLPEPSMKNKIINAIPKMRAGRQCSETAEIMEDLLGTSPSDGLIIGPHFLDV